MHSDFLVFFFLAYSYKLIYFHGNYAFKCTVLIVYNYNLKFEMFNNEIETSLS